MIYQAAAVLVFLALGASAQFNPCQPNPVCNLTDLARCQAAFDCDAGIDTSLSVYNYTLLQDAVEGLIGASGTAGLEKICQALRGYKTCFTDVRQYDFCMMNPLGLVGDRNCQATGISEAQARGFTRLYSSLDFACGFGYSHFWNAEDRNAGCMSNVFKNSLPALHACQDDFDRQAAANPQFQCTFVSQSTNCFSRAFRDCGEQGQWFGCEFQRMGLQAAYGNCGQEFCRFGI